MNDQERLKHGRRHETGPTVAVVVGNLRGAWNGGVFAGDAELLAWARARASASFPAEVFGVGVVCDDRTPLGALASMASFSPGRCVVLRAPEDVREVIAGEVGMPDPLIGSDISKFISAAEDDRQRIARRAGVR